MTQPTARYHSVVKTCGYIKACLFYIDVVSSFRRTCQFDFVPWMYSMLLNVLRLKHPATSQFPSITWRKSTSNTLTTPCTLNLKRPFLLNKKLQQLILNPELAEHAWLIWKVFKDKGHAVFTNCFAKYPLKLAIHAVRDTTQNAATLQTGFVSISCTNLASCIGSRIDTSD